MLLEKNYIENWHITLKISEKFYKVFPISANGQQLIVEDIENGDFFNNLLNNVTYFNSLNNCNILSIGLGVRNLFFVCFEGNIESQELGYIKFIIESLVDYESKNLSQYPSFLPFFIPFNEEEIVKINTTMLVQKKLFFLNGLSGTGRKTFINNHLQYKYSIDFKKALFDFPFSGNISHYDFSYTKIKIMIIKEVAFLTESEQAEIIKNVREENNLIVFILSTYDPILLSSNGVIIDEIKSECLENRIIFPSLHRRMGYLKKSIETLLYLKGIDFFDIVSIKSFEKQISTGGFSEIFNSFQKYLTPQPSILNSFFIGQDLREMVKNLEILGIEFGQWKIGNSQNKISKFLGMSRGSLQHKLKKYKYPYNDWEE
jgi:hypothetical protein